MGAVVRSLRAARGVFRAAAFAACALSLSACSSDPWVENPGRDLKIGDMTIQTRDGPGWSKSSVGEWRIENQADRITGKPSLVAFVETKDSWNGGQNVYPQAATLTLACVNNYPLVRIAFQFKVGTTKQTQIGYRFDRRPGHETDARVLPDHTIVVLEEPQEVATFVSELATAKSLYVRIQALNWDRTSAEFKQLDGASEAIAATIAKCPPQRIIDEQRKQEEQNPRRRTSALN
jgi:hypothetical protein